MTDTPEPPAESSTSGSAPRQPARVSSITPSAVTDARFGVRRQLTALAWPAVVEYLLQTALSVATIIMVGRLGGVEIAAVGLGQQVAMVAWVAYIGIATGATALVAQNVGATEFHRAEVVAKQSLMAGLGFSVVVGAAGAVLAGDVMSALGATTEVVATGVNYLRILMSFSVFQMAMFVTAGILRGAGDMKTPMVVNGIANGVNICLGYGLIFGEMGFPRLGVDGAAWATIVAQGLGTLLLLMVLFLRPRYLRLSWRGDWLPTLEITKLFLDISGPSVVEQVFMRLGMLAYAILVVSMGTEVYATQQILFNVLSISFMPGFALGVAATTMVGQNMGARQTQRAERSGWAAAEMGVIWMSLMGIVFFAFARECMAVFTSDPHLIELGEPCLKIIALVQPAQAVAFALAGALRGAGDTRWPMYATTVTIWLLRLPLAYLFGITLALNLTGVWIGHALDFTIRSAMLLWRYRSGDWKYMRI